MDEIIDKEYIERSNQKRVILHSKLSILLATVLLSPFIGAILFGINLYKTNQQNKIFGMATTLVVCNLMVFLPLLGFPISYEDFGFHIYISRLITSLLLIFPIWKSHFKGSLFDYKFDIKLFALLILTAFILLPGIWTLLQKIFNFPSEFFIQPFLLIGILIMKQFVDLAKGKSSPQ